MLVLTAINLLLSILAIIFFIPKDFFRQKNIDLKNLFKKNFFPILIILLVVFFHLIEVNILDSIATKQINKDYANLIEKIEGNIVYSFTNYWNQIMIVFFVLIYIAVYPFTLWFTPIYFFLKNEQNALKQLAYGLLIIYIISLPFYFFMPITNVYTFYGMPSALESVIPSVENFFYSTTTTNNCLPSLHTAMTILIAYTVSRIDNKRYLYFTLTIMFLVLISVLYLAIHWMLDVLAGILLAGAVILILRFYFDDTKT